MNILSVNSQPKIPVDIKYKRMLNKLNLQVRDKIETLDMFYPFDTFEKRQELKAIEDWKNSQKTILHEKCYNPQPSLFKRICILLKKLR